jgi:hypothetical protein
MTRVERARITVIFIALGLVVGLAPAGAQSAEAEALFVEGRRLVKQGKVAAGCDKLDASARLDSSVGTLLNLGDCREKLGELASSWAAFRKAESLAKQSGKDEKRQLEAHNRAAQIEPNLATLAIDVKSPVVGLVVHRDAEVVDGAALGTPIPVDPDRYTVVVEAPGYKPWRTDIIVLPKSKRRVAVPALTPEPQQARAPQVAAAAPASASTTFVAQHPMASSEPVIITHQRTWSTTRKVSVWFAVLGLGAIGTGVYFGMHAVDLRDQADKRCPLSVCADGAGLRLNAEAQTDAMRANVLYIAGGVGVASAALLWIIGKPGDDRIQPTFSDGHVGLAYGGKF